MNERIVSAANKNKQTGDLLIGVRHWDESMRNQCKILMSIEKATNMSSEWDQGFITNKYRYVSREEAYDIAEREGQIIRECGNPSQRVLYTEHLY